MTIFPGPIWPGPQCGVIPPRAPKMYAFLRFISGLSTLYLGFISGLSRGAKPGFRGSQKICFHSSSAQRARTDLGTPLPPPMLGSTYPMAPLRGRVAECMATKIQHLCFPKSERRAYKALPAVKRALRCSFSGTELYMD